MEDVLAETAITYPEVYVKDMTGSQIKAVMEDIVDNLFNPDPYYQQGGDMVRVGGMDYACAPNEAAGKRISDMTLDDGRAAKPTRLPRRRLGVGQPAERQAGQRSRRGLSAGQEDDYDQARPIASHSRASPTIPALTGAASTMSRVRIRACRRSLAHWPPSARCRIRNIRRRLRRRPETMRSPTSPLPTTTGAAAL